MINKQIEESRILFPINLQLFADKGDDSSDSDLDVVDSDEDFEDDDDFEGDDDSGDDENDTDDEDAEGDDAGEDEEQDVVDPDSKHAKNDYYKKMRLKAEEQASKKLSAEREKLDADRAAIRAEKMQLTEQLVERNILNSITPDAVWKRADEEGISEQSARKLIEAETKTLIDAEKNKVRTHFQNLEAKKSELRKEEFYPSLEREIDEICTQRPDVDPVSLYHLLVGQRYKELSKTKSKQQEKGAIANQHDRMRRRTVTGTGTTRAPAGNLSKVGREAAIAMGLDPRDVAKHVSKRRGNFRI